MRTRTLVAYACIVITIAAALSCNYFNRSGINNEILLHNLKSNDTAIRYKAARQLEDIELMPSEQITFLKAATSQFPPARYEWQTIPSLLVRAATKEYNPVLSKFIGDLFPGFDSIAREQALAYLTANNDKRSVELYVDIFQRYHDSIGDFSAGNLKEGGPDIARIVFPGLLKYTTDERHGYSLTLLLLDYFHEGTLKPASYEPQKVALLNKAITLRHQLTTVRQHFSRGMDIWSNEEYIDLRDAAGVYTDILGYFNDDAISSELRQYLELDDNSLRLFAASSLLRMQRPVDARYLHAIAADAETRNLLYNRLTELNKADLFPAEFYSQAAFAESDMVHWLTYPTELGRVPDEIQLMKVVEVDTRTDDGLAAFYLYRFRSADSAWKEEGWMTGVSGYFKKGKPTTEAGGYTFSTFEKWDSKTPEQHLAEVRKLLTDEEKKKE